MLTVERRERIRRAYYVEGKSIRQIVKELGHSYWTVRGALDGKVERHYQLTKKKKAPVLGAYHQRIAELLAESEQQPRKQRYSNRKIYALLQKEGYRGSESGVRRYIGELRREQQRPAVYVPLSFEPGQDAQVDWGEVVVKLGGVETKVELFVMRLCYSRKTFAMLFPTQRQECFFAGHVAAFADFAGVPQRISYDNLKTAVKQILEGKNRIEQEAFVALRSHYLFESRYCTPATGNEKGGVEHGVGYVRRNFLTPLLAGESFAELNQQLLSACHQDEQRTVARQPASIASMWAAERHHLQPLSAEYPCCRSHQVTLNPYSQVVFESNRYSVPTDQAKPHLVLKAYPFHIEILDGATLLARHERTYQREQDCLDPLHYLPLLAERPGAFEHSSSMRQWRKQWPAVYEQILHHLRQNATGTSLSQQESRAIRSFIDILLLHRRYPAELMEQALHEVLRCGTVNREGVLFCLNRLLDPTPQLAALELKQRPGLAQMTAPKPDLHHFNQLLTSTANRRPNEVQP